MDGPVFGEGAANPPSGEIGELNDFERRFGGLLLSTAVVIVKLACLPPAPPFANVSWGPSLLVVDTEDVVGAGDAAAALIPPTCSGASTLGFFT